MKASHKGKPLTSSEEEKAAASTVWSKAASKAPSGQVTANCVLSGASFLVHHRTQKEREKRRDSGKKKSFYAAFVWKSINRKLMLHPNTIIIYENEPVIPSLHSKEVGNNHFLMNGLVLLKFLSKRYRRGSTFVSALFWSQEYFSKHGEKTDGDQGGNSGAT